VETFVNKFKFRWRQVVAGNPTFISKKEHERLEVEERTWITRNGDEVTEKFGNHIRWYGNDLIRSYFGYRRLGESILSAFYNAHNNRNESPIIEKTLRTDFRGYRLMGRIDRVDIKPDGLAIVTDYKTSKKAPSEHFLQTTPQLTIYDLLVRDYNFGTNVELSDVALYIYHLRTLAKRDNLTQKQRIRKALFPATRTSHHLDTLERKCEEYEKAVADERFVPRYGSHCNYCDYQQPCLEYAVDSEGPRHVLLPPEQIKDPMHADIFFSDELV